MAKESMKARDAKRLKLITKYKSKREQLIKEGNWTALDKLPKNASPVRYRNRCKITGRPRGYIGFFGLSRIQFRDLASYGMIPGLSKASW
jgi:small subunit ribosomal protein S14